ncbi:TetR family transcriptional regulator [Acidovorax sp. DW039]|uniref:TetR family transcriptional regulator n=1 Tax=Acidovorax sp. DW039 TaxID=3095606 RepID=UPI00308C413E|nr:TetR family transcriptional regulator [Acidovorax sp. DW039]
MVRRTRQEALQTRQSILDGALEVFMEQGFQRCSMQDVADRAGVTRGAVYWHFRDRFDLLEALLDTTQLPWEVLKPWERAPSVATPAMPLRHMLARMATAPLAWLEGSQPTQQVLRILGQVSEPEGTAPLVARLDADRSAGLQCLQSALAQGAAKGDLRSGADPATAALGLFALVDGLMHQWLRQPAAFGLAAVGTQAVQSHLAGLLAA